MNKIIFSLLVFCVALFSCSPRYVYVSQADPEPDTSYVFFTTELKNRIENNNVDIKKVQFYIKKGLVLRREMGGEKGEVKSGVLTFENGQYIHEVIIPAYTMGVCESVKGESLSISFELNNNTIEFTPGGKSGNIFCVRLSKDEDNYIRYDNKLYKVRYQDNDYSKIASLLVRKNEADKFKSTKRVIEGRKVD